MLVELDGLNVPLMPAGSPVALKLTVPVNPFAGTTVMTSLPPNTGRTTNLEAAADRLNLGAAEAVITSVTVVVCVMPFETPEPLDVPLTMI